MQKYIFSLPFKGAKDLFVEININEVVSFSFSFDRKILSEPTNLPFKLDEIETFLERLDILVDFSFPEGIAVLLGFSSFKIHKSLDKDLPKLQHILSFIRKTENSLACHFGEDREDDSSDLDMYLDGFHEYADKFRKLNPSRTEYKTSIPSFEFIDETRTIIYKGKRLEFTKSTDSYDRVKCLIQELISRKQNSNSDQHFIGGRDMDDIFESGGIDRCGKQQFKLIFRDDTLAKIEKFALIQNNRFSLK